MGKIKEIIEMYDNLLANLYAGGLIFNKNKLDVSKISIGFSHIASETMVFKYFMINSFPDFIDGQLIDHIRASCIQPGVRINMYTYGDPFRINWESAEMRSRMRYLQQYTENQSASINPFEMREKLKAVAMRERILLSTQYLNDAELVQKRTTFKVSFVVEISSRRDEQSQINLYRAISLFKSMCGSSGMKYREIRVNVIDWMSQLGMFSLKHIKEVANKIAKKTITDDVLSVFNGYKQGRIGASGVPIGMDVMSRLPVLRVLKEDPDAAENWLISAETGGGKSYYVKTLLTYLLASGFVVTVMDYEGDEYYNLANYIRAGNPEDVIIISAGKGSAVYFDPMEIPDLTGADDVDEDLKDSAMQYTLAVFRVIVSGPEGTMSIWEESVISAANKRVYDDHGITEDRGTWKRSKGLRISMVYDEVKRMVNERELLDETTDNQKHKAAVKILEYSSMYFEEGHSKSGTFKQPMSANELFKAKLIIFSFGMRGATSSQVDPTLMALKQLSVANVAIQVSNHSKYIRKCFNVKVWEEFQRWGEIAGSSEIISNAMTGGRKRGDVNFLITNDLGEVLDLSNPVSRRLRQNFTVKVIGKVSDESVRAEFCKRYSVPELIKPLETIAKANSAEAATSNSASGRYRKAFCIVTDDNKKAIVKVMLPASISKTQLFRTGVEVEDGEVK